MTGPPRSSRLLPRLAAGLLALATLAGCGSSGTKAASDTAASAGSSQYDSSAAGTTASTLRGSGPGEPCHSASAPSVPGEPAVDMPTKAPDALVTKDLTVGTGATATLGSSVTVNYVGVACSTGIQFDASWGQGQPATFDLVEGGLIEGWVKGIPGMKVGGRRQLVIPPSLGYGDASPTKAIRPGETLVFVVDLVAVGAAGAGSGTAN